MEKLHIWSDGVGNVAVGTEGPDGELNMTLATARIMDVGLGPCMIDIQTTMSGPDGALAAAMLRALRGSVY